MLWLIIQIHLQCTSFVYLHFFVPRVHGRYSHLYIKRCKSQCRDSKVCRFESLGLIRHDNNSLVVAILLFIDFNKVVTLRPESFGISSDIILTRHGITELLFKTPLTNKRIIFGNFRYRTPANNQSRLSLIMNSIPLGVKGTLY